MSAPGPAGHDQQSQWVPTAPTPEPAPPAAPPPPPPGPGVTPPFPAAPTEGTSIRLWLGLGVAGLAFLLCCGGGLTAMVALFITGTEAINEQAGSAVEDHFDAVRAGRYEEAYEELCPAARERETRRQFASRMAAQPRIEEYEVGDVRVSPTIWVPVQVWYESGERASIRVELEQDTGTGELEVCRVER